MLSKFHRLSRPEFNQVKRSGRKIFHISYLVYDLPSLDFKISVVVSKKIAKKAVQRNSLRRYLYNHLAKHYQGLNHHLIIYPQKHEENLSDLDQVLSKIS